MREMLTWMGQLCASLNLARSCLAGPLTPFQLRQICPIIMLSLCLGLNSFIINQLLIQFFLFVSKDLLERHGVRSSYEIIHAVWNLIVASITFTDTAYVLSHPESCCLGTSKYDSILLVVHIHVFHLLGYYPINAADLNHHIIMIVFCTPFATVTKSGLLTQCCSFFICGLPGAMTYGAIGACRNGLMSKQTSKHINLVVNLVLRCPCAVITGYIGLLNAHKSGSFLGVLPSIVISINGIYYSYLAIQDQVLSSKGLQ